MAQHFGSDWSFDVALTDDSHLAAGRHQYLPVDDVVNYLNESPRHAVILLGHRSGGGTIMYRTTMFVLRGTSGEPTNFYYGSMPAEDPNDSMGGDLTAEEALRDAAEHYHEFILSK